MFEQIINSIFIASAIAFNLLIAAIFIAMKNDRSALVRVLGIYWLGLSIPLTVVFVYDLFAGSKLTILLAFGLIFLYMFVELLFDYILKIDFRSKPILHAPYIILEYAALFSLIWIGFTIDRTVGILISVCFWILMGSLIYHLSGRKKKQEGFR